MDAIVQFFQDLVTITLGVIAVFFWVIIFFAGAIEFFDKITGADKKKNPDYYNKEEL